MIRTIGHAPTIEEIAALARDALHRLPAPFVAAMGEVVLIVQDFADPATFDAMDMDDTFALTGLYEGTPLTERSIEDSGQMPDRVRLFRRAILEEWAARGDESLEHLVAHVLIHEIGHHFGLSDDDIDALEAEAAA